MEKKTVVIRSWDDDNLHEGFKVGDRVMLDMLSEFERPSLLVNRKRSFTMPRIGLHRVRSRIGIRKKRSVTKMVFLTKPKYSKRSRLSNFWPKMPRSKDLGDLLRYHLGRIKHE